MLSLPRQKSKPANLLAGSNNSGYTLVEILIAVGLIGTITAFSIGYYRDFNDRRVVRSVAEKLQSQLRLISSRAINNQKDCSQCSGADSRCGTADDLVLSGWYIDFSSVNPEDTRIYGQCNGTEFSSKQLDFLAGYNLNTNEVVQFKPLTGETNLSSALTVEISNETGSTVFQITIDNGGSISDLEEG